ncbi:hypothetical protein [Sporosarcina trichiuri]|uniref:hypothetical protein n=1 Tax=Sporosarcina trichiuri TaxID=3056445 RepID=UPI0025B5A4E8|nr:hypothetical protein [Sporosarcina sp. 0.2-SM1T-5]WJY28269.1 hypothetical protein QWT68_04610 [Sporosarcina sp. 0.2-SM1T-5]
MSVRKLMLLAAFALLLTACGDAGMGNPTAKNILKENPEADIVRVGSFVYTASEKPAAEMTNLEKGINIGKVKKTTDSPYFFHDFYASRLEKGSKIYSTDKHGSREDTLYILVIEEDGELYEYYTLLEG